MKRRVKTHTASAQDNSAPVPWRWRSREARIGRLIDVPAHTKVLKAPRSDTRMALRFFHKPQGENDIGKKGLACEDGFVNRSLPRKEARPCPILTAQSFRQQVSLLRRQFLQDGDLPFTDVLTEEVIAQALTALPAGWTASSPRWSRCGSSWAKSSAPTTPAAPPSPA